MIIGEDRGRLSEDGSRKKVTWDERTTAPDSPRRDAAEIRGGYAVAGAGVPRPGNWGGTGLGGTSGSGVPAGAPIGGDTGGSGGGAVSFPVRTISSTCAPSSVSY